MTIEELFEARLELAREGAVAHTARIICETATKKRNKLIVDLYNTGEYTQKELARIASISTSAVTDILRH